MATVLQTPYVAQFVVGPVTGNRYVPNGGGQITVVDVDVPILEDLGFAPPTGGSGSITAGTSPIASGANTRVLFDDSGVLNEDAGLTYTKAAASLTVQSGTSPQIQATISPVGITVSPDTSNTASQGFTIKSKAVADLSTGLAVAYLVPAAGVDVWMAQDISPRGSPADNFSSAGYRGTAWIDICSTNETVTEGGTYGCLSLGKCNSGDKRCVIDGNAAVAGTPSSVPIYMQPSGGSLYIGSPTPYTVAGPAVGITRDSTAIGTENAGISINTSTAAQPELLLGVDHTKAIAYIQSASLGTSFTTIPLALNPNGGVVAIGSTAGTVDVAMARNAAGVLEVNSGTAGTFRDVKARNIVSSAGVVTLAVFTVATLPASPAAGSTAYVSDATAPTYLGALTGGGAVKCPVFYNGASWVSA